MKIAGFAGFVLMLASLSPAAAVPATMASPQNGLHDLAGRWTCTYRAGSTSMNYTAVYTNDLNGHVLRQVTSFSGGGGDEELIAYDAQHHGWTAVVVDDHGSATVLRAPGSNPNHAAYHSISPDASIAVTFERISSAKYVLNGTYRTGGKTIVSVDTCTR